MSASPDHLSTSEAAAALGWTVTKVRDAVREDRLPATVVAGNIRIPRSAVDALAPGGSPTVAAPDEFALIEHVLGQSISTLPLLLDPEWLAPRLGMSQAAVRRAMANGEIPSVVVGKRRRCPTVALVRWLSTGRVAA